MPAEERKWKGIGIQPRQETRIPFTRLYINLTIGFIPRKHVNTMQAGLLACNIFAVLPISPETVDFFYRTPVSPRRQWLLRGKNTCVTYSCGTACDLHTIPY
jgi:hypothetical protein